LIKKKVKIYLSPQYIAGINLGKSTWFEGYNQKYFYVGGKVFAAIFPCFSYFLVIRSAYRFSRSEKCDLSFKTVLKNYFKGIHDYKFQLKK
jgi:hypothetical protein